MYFPDAEFKDSSDSFQSDSIYWAECFFWAFQPWATKYFPQSSNRACAFLSEVFPKFIWTALICGMRWKKWTLI